MKKKIPIIIIGIIVIFVILVVVSMVLEEIDMYEYEKAEKEALSKISVKVPKKFERSSYSSTIYYHLYDEETRCSFIVDVEADSYNYEDGMEYLEKRTQLKRVFMLIDFRHKPSEDDLLMYNFLKYYNLPVTVIATKSDKISGGAKQKNLKQILDTMDLVIGDDLIVFSSVTKLGVEDVLNKIESLLVDSNI